MERIDRMLKRIKTDKKRRLSVYKKMKNALLNEEPYPVGFCQALFMSVKRKDYFYAEEDYLAEQIVDHLTDILPELKKYKPEKESMETNNYWFSVDEKGIQKRIDILTKIINQL